MINRITTTFLIIIFTFAMSVSVFATEGEEIIDDLEYELMLKEKGSIEVSEKQQLSFEKEIDEAYNRVMTEEKYIINLINSFDIKKKTSIENWEFNLSFLQKNYNTIKKMSDVKMYYVDSYIGAYEIVKLNIQAPDEKKYTLETPQAIALRTSDGGYDISEAVNYAKKYYYSYNIAYPDWSSYGGDCANFVSQCLYAGGKPWKGTPGSITQAQNFGNWFSTGSAENTSNVSSTWRGADAFRHYWQMNSLSHKRFNRYTSDAYDYGYRGDAVSLLTSTSRAYHTLIIVGYSNDSLIYAAHTRDTFSGELKHTSNFIIFSMKYGQN